ncbi:hypothetical protein QLQ12_21465 [Actinoplanes sp. NEAU-A12]|uniref:SnoaL-like domain-containing protein n=1 Tax=Actinoplanes sandaracinus TaxID=3045177 RepID=A0ABT6WNA2_9ACTN|nr:hypothetical protein [Actinoplanes sandaracinus]MDI6101187.1 hypothetical protein [Actinoplanes sandaracinus]
MTTDPSTTAGPPLAERLLAEMSDLCEAYAREQVARALAEHSADHNEHQLHTNRADYWGGETLARYNALVTAITAAVPQEAEAQLEEFRPVRTLANGHVEIHARDQHARPVVVRFTGAEAVTVGVHLTVHAAIGLDRTGAKVDQVLPPVLAAVPPAVIGEPPVPVIGRAPAPQ